MKEKRHRYLIATGHDDYNDDDDEDDNHYNRLPW